MKKINLLNSEGPLITVEKSDTGFLNVIDEFGKNVAIWNNIQFVEFITGYISVTDSIGRSWNFGKLSENWKCSSEHLYTFLRENIK